MEVCSFKPIMMMVCSKGRVVGIIYDIPPGSYSMEKASRPFAPINPRDHQGTDVPWAVLTEEVKENGLKEFLEARVGRLAENGDVFDLSEIEIGVPMNQLTGSCTRIYE